GRRGSAESTSVLPGTAAGPSGGEGVMTRIPSVPKLPYVLLGALTLVTFGGPLAMLVVVRGGPSARGPPDRAVEWIVIGLVFTLAIGLFSACVSIGWWYRWPQPVSRTTATEDSRSSTDRSTT